MSILHRWCSGSVCQAFQLRQLSSVAGSPALSLSHQHQSFLRFRDRVPGHLHLSPTLRRNYGIFGPPSGSGEGIFTRVARRFGWTETPKSVLSASGYMLYIKIADEVNFNSFFTVCRMPDTFQSWFIVAELHTWLLSARLMGEGEEGQRVRNSMIQALWGDTDVRSKKLPGAVSSARKAQVQELHEQFQANLFGYDEGIQGDDRVLAGALWRRFLQNTEPASQAELLGQIVALEMLVAYVRSSYHKLQGLSKKELILRRNFAWTPFTKDVLDPDLKP